MEVTCTTGTESASKAELAQYIVEIEIAEDILLGIPLFESGRSEGVILLTFFRVREYSIGLADLLELVFSLFIAGVFVWMILKGQFPVCFLDFIGTGRFGHTQDLIVLHKALEKKVNINKRVRNPFSPS
jgi:hypothetical protein